jgi:hypothetical protein
VSSVVQAEDGRQVIVDKHAHPDVPTVYLVVSNQAKTFSTRVGLSVQAREELIAALIALR